MEGVASLLLGKGEFYCFRRCKNTAVFLNVNRKMGMAKKKHIPFVEVGRLEGAKKFRSRRKLARGGSFS